jgi:mono/diheme cytochrome c family protein
VRIDRIFSLSSLVAFALLTAFPHPTTATQADDQAITAKGEYLARAGDCIACHTNPGGALFAGGFPMATPSVAWATRACGAESRLSIRPRSRVWRRNGGG